MIAYCPFAFCTSNRELLQYQLEESHVYHLGLHMQHWNHNPYLVVSRVLSDPLALHLYFAQHRLIPQWLSQTEAFTFAGSVIRKPVQFTVSAHCSTAKLTFSSISEIQCTASTHVAKWDACAQDTVFCMPKKVVNMHSERQKKCSLRSQNSTKRCAREILPANWFSAGRLCVLVGVKLTAPHIQHPLNEEKWKGKILKLPYLNDIKKPITRRRKTDNSKYVIVWVLIDFNNILFHTI